MKCLFAFTVIALLTNSHLWAKSLQGVRITRAAERDEKKLWPKGIVPVTIHKSFTPEERQVIYSGIKTIESVSCIRFVKHSEEKDYVEIVKGEGCSAVRGRRGGRQEITLGDGCVHHGTVIHELMHALGFYHEHVRPDRDKYVTVVEDNIIADNLHNFKKRTEKELITFGAPYDPYSILHYKPTYFAKDKKKMSMKANGGTASFGTTDKLTKTDIWKMKRLYRCFDRPKVYRYQIKYTLRCRRGKCRKHIVKTRL